MPRFGSRSTKPISLGFRSLLLDGTIDVALTYDMQLDRAYALRRTRACFGPMCC